MQVFTRTVMDWDGSILEQDSEEYNGPVALCGGGGGRGKGGSIPAPPPAPPAPPSPAKTATGREATAAEGREATAAATQAVEDQRNRVKQSMGQQGTILTSPLGAQPVQQQGKSLLGQ